MIYWSFELELQKKLYLETRRKIKNGFYQDLSLYILPKIPNKFRDRVVFFPKTFLPKTIYSKHKGKILKTEKEWKDGELKFIQKIEKYFPDISKIDIYISPSLYGTIGSYDTKHENKVYIYPRYDRKLVDIQKLVINTLTHFFYFDKFDDMDKVNKSWYTKQEVSKNIQDELFPSIKYRSMTDILNRQFLGKLAIESSNYLENLGYKKQKQIKRPKNLTKNEQEVFDLLSKNKNKIVSFEKISDAIWQEDSFDKYSEYAITKMVERLKKKLPKYTIHTQRKVGYLLLSS